jgi:hypothetical protein
MKVRPVTRNDTASLLPAVLKRKQTKLRQRRSFLVAEDAENAAFLVKFVEREIHRELDIDDLVPDFVRCISVKQITQFLRDNLRRIVREITMPE